MTKKKSEVETFVATQSGTITIEGDNIKIGGSFLDELNKSKGSMINLLLGKTDCEMNT